MSRYDALHDWLVEQPDTEIALTFSDIEMIIGADLPESARKYQAWWANQNPPSTQSLAWLSAGWRASPRLNDERVVFRKSDSDILSFSRDFGQTKEPDEGSAQGLSEDSVKTLLCAYLKRDGWTTTVAMGAAHGIDIEARRDTERWVIEVKGCGSLNPMRVNYFLAVLGEILQRMGDPNAKYSIALPDLDQFRGLWERLPSLAKSRTCVSCLFVRDDGAVEELS